MLWVAAVVTMVEHSCVGTSSSNMATVVERIARLFNSAVSVHCQAILMPSTSAVFHDRRFGVVALRAFEQPLLPSLAGRRYPRQHRNCLALRTTRTLDRARRIHRRCSSCHGALQFWRGCNNLTVTGGCLNRTAITNCTKPALPSLCGSRRNNSTISSQAWNIGDSPQVAGSEVFPRNFPN